MKKQITQYQTSDGVVYTKERAWRLHQKRLYCARKMGGEFKRVLRVLLSDSDDDLTIVIESIGDMFNTDIPDWTTQGSLSVYKYKHTVDTFKYLKDYLNVPEYRIHITGGLIPNVVYYICITELHTGRSTWVWHDIGVVSMSDLLKGAHNAHMVYTALFKGHLNTVENAQNG